LTPDPAAPAVQYTAPDRRRRASVTAQEQLAMQDEPHTEVFGFRVSGAFVEVAHTSRFKATKDTIQSLGAELLPGTRQLVHKSELDERGLYRRVNTGWGDLS
jgi:hypothetical protein